MPHNQAGKKSPQATLELDSGLHLAGTLSSDENNEIKLGAPQLVQGSAPDGKISIRPGAQAKLVLPQNGDKDDPPLSVAVTIAGVSGIAITLTFSDADEDTARQVMRSIPHRKTTERTDRLVAATAEYSQLLEQHHQQSTKQLEQILVKFVSELATHLLDVSTRISRAKNGRNVLYEASVTVRGKGTRLASDVMTLIEEYFHDLTPAVNGEGGLHNDNRDKDSLDLVDVREFEDYLTIDRIITTGEDLYPVALEALTIRLATLIDKDPRKVRLPVHVRQLCLAFQRVISSVDIEQDVLPHVFDYFTVGVVRKLADYYERLNQHLARAGVDPDIETEIQSKGSLLREKAPRKPPERPLSSTAAAAIDSRPAGPAPGQSPPAVSGAPAAGEVTAGAAAAPFSHANLYQSVIDALNFKREDRLVGSDDQTGERTTIRGGSWDGGVLTDDAGEPRSLADEQALVQALGQLQHSAKGQSDLQKSDSMRQYLSERKDQLQTLKHTSGLSVQTLNQLDLVDNLFGTIRSQASVASELQPALGNLQIPLAKLALLEPQFFTDPTNPARQVVDRLSRLSRSANFPNKGLETQISHVVDDIVANYETDSAVFTSALGEIEKLTTQQQRVLKRNISRVVDTQEGQERLHKAKQTVARLINDRLKPPQVPQILVDLINSGWRDLLVLTHVREGPDSEAWVDQIDTLDTLTSWLAEGPLPAESGAEQARRAEDTDRLLRSVQQLITTALPTNVEHEKVLAALRDILTGSADVSMMDFDGFLEKVEPPTEQVRARVDQLPRLRRWIKRVEQLEKSAWLTYRDQDGVKQRMQLAWISEAHDRFIFVNERGQKIADMSAIKLARQLSQGMRQVNASEDMSLVDKSMYDTLELMQKKLSFERNYDTLTRLINRSTFLSQMSRALQHAREKDSSNAVLYINIDQFALVNDVFDKVNGDQVLLEFARLLAQLHGKKSSSARIHGDEFAVLLLNRSIDEALQIAEKIRADIEAGSVEIDGEKVSFTVSIGVAPLVQHSPDVEQVLNAARAAMYLAKETGRNRVVQFEEDQASANNYLAQKYRSRQDIETALATDRLVLRAQPIIQTTVQGENPVRHHFELLLGVTNKDGSLSSPEEFIRSAEDYGFMNLVDRWVIREAFKWISGLVDEQKIVPFLSINLSGHSVTDDSFMEYLLEQISEFGVGTSRLCFEITETGTISNLVKAADFVRAFRNIGCKFSIDDFGTGLASHTYLRELPVDYVKIDGSFVLNIDKNRKDYAMVRSINDLAHFLGQETIAESVESEAIVLKLREIGVDYLQGWEMGMPQLLPNVAANLPSIEK